MIQTLDSLMIGLTDEQIVLPGDVILTDMLLDVRFEATFFGSTDVENAVDSLMAAMKSGHLDHYHRVSALRILHGLVKAYERTPAFSG